MTSPISPCAIGFDLYHAARLRERHLPEPKARQTLQEQAQHQPQHGERHQLDIAPVGAPDQTLRMAEAILRRLAMPTQPMEGDNAAKLKALELYQSAEQELEARLESLEAMKVASHQRPIAPGLAAYMAGMRTKLQPEPHGLIVDRYI